MGETTIQMVEVKFDAPKQTNDIGVAGGKFMAVLAVALENGWQWEDAMTIVSGIYSEAVEAGKDITLVDDEFKAKPFRASLGLVVPMTLGAEEMYEKLKAAKEAKEAAETEATPTE